MIAENRNLLIGMAVCLLIFAMAHYVMIAPNWKQAEDHFAAAEENRVKWDKLFKAGDKLIPLPEAEKAIKDSNAALQRKLDELKQVEFGTFENLRTFALSSAGSGDPKNYQDTMKKQMYQHAKDASLNVPIELGIVDKADETVSLNLFRLAMVDRLLTACKDAGVGTVSKLRFDAPTRIAPNEVAVEPVVEDDRGTRGKNGKGDKGAKNEKDEKEKPESAVEPDVLVRFPMRVVIAAPERVFSQFLYEVQKPSDTTHGYFCLRGAHVYVRDASTGMVEASVSLQALLNQKTVLRLGIPLGKEGEDRRRGYVPKEVDLDRY